MKLREAIRTFKERGGSITDTDIYKSKGTYPVYTAKTSGFYGFYDKYNYELTNNSLIYSLNGAKAGYVLISNFDKIWFSNDTGILELEARFLEKYNKETIAIYFNYLFENNRHNTGSRPKFSLNRCLDIELDLNELSRINNFVKNQPKNKLYKKLLTKELKNEIIAIKPQKIAILKDMIESYEERGKRLTAEKDLYSDYGSVEVYSADTSGPMGYYKSSNHYLKENGLIYTIDGNAGSILLINERNIWLTDHAGVIYIKPEYINTYGKTSLAIYLQHVFQNNCSSKDGRPQFLIKKVLNTEINLDELEYISKIVEKLVTNN